MDLSNCVIIGIILAEIHFIIIYENTENYKSPSQQHCG